MDFDIDFAIMTHTDRLNYLACMGGRAPDVILEIRALAVSVLALAIMVTLEEPDEGDEEPHHIH